jgi:hypothetical protein
MSVTVNLSKTAELQRMRVTLNSMEALACVKVRVNV